MGTALTATRCVCLLLAVVLTHTCSGVGTLANLNGTQAYPCDHPLGDCHVIYEWVKAEFDWPTAEMKKQYQHDGRYIASHNLISGVKVYKDAFYVTVPRLRYTNGVPSTLNKVIKNSQGKPLLQPFPNWETQQLGDCQNLQNVMSTEIDPLEGHIYVIDSGRAGILGQDINATHLCQPKLIVFDLLDGRQIRSHVLPESIASKETNFLNDLVLDRGDVTSDTVKRVYISDNIDAKLYVIDLSTNETRAFYHPSMEAEDGEASSFVLHGVKYNLNLPINGIALSGDFKYLYYCAVGSKKLYMVETQALIDPSLDLNAYVTLVGNKASQTGGMIYATDSLFFGALAYSAVYRWDIRDDMVQQHVDQTHVQVKTQVVVLQDQEKLVWPDSFAIDDKGYLYVMSNRANRFLKGHLDFMGHEGPNFRLWRIKINQKSYLARNSRDRSTNANRLDNNNNMSPAFACSRIATIVLVIVGFLTKRV